MKRFLLITVLAVCVGEGRVMAALTILDFEALAHSGEIVFYDSISEDGFTLSADDLRIGITGSSGIHNQGDSYKGSTTAWTHTGHTAYLLKDDSGPFDLDSIDVARFSDRWTEPAVATIIGYDATGAEVASQSFTLPDTGDESLHTYVLDSSFSGIYKASWAQDYFQFDNIVVNPVPEPVTALLLGLGGFAFLRKRRQV